jgi:hypothetical protein
MLAYCGCAVFLTAHLWIDPGRREVTNPADVDFITFWLRWMPHAIGSGQNPFFCSALNLPLGVNVMWQTALLFQGLILAPVTLAAGPVVTFNVLLAVGPAASAASAYAVLRHRLGGEAGPALGGLCYGFSPAMVAESLAHPQLTFAVLPPLLLLLWCDTVSGRQRPRLAALLLGGLAAVQFFSGEELLVLTGIVAVLLLPWLRVARPLPWRPLGAAVAAFVLLTGYPIAEQLFGSQRVHGNIQMRGHFQEDLANFVVPSRLSAVHFSPQAWFPTGVQEQTAYLGLPLLAFVVVLGVRHWSDRRVRAGCVTAGVLAVLSLGSHLDVGGWHTPIPLPWAIVERAPLLGNALPSRFPLLIGLCTGGLVALAVCHWGRRGAAAAALALLPLVPHPLPVQHVPAVPAYFTGHPAGRVLVLPFPTPTQTAAMRWQAASGISFAMPGGFFVGPSRRGHAQFGSIWRPTSRLLDEVAATGVVPAVGDPQRAQARIDLRYWQVDRVVLGPGPHTDALRETVSALLGYEPRDDHGVYVWTAPSGR